MWVFIQKKKRDSWVSLNQNQADASGLLDSKPMGRRMRNNICGKRKDILVLVCTALISHKNNRIRMGISDR